MSNIESNKLIVQKTKEALKEMGVEVKTTQIYEMYSKVLGEKSWNVAKSKNLDFKSGLSTEQSVLATQAVKETPNLASQYDKIPLEDLITQYFETHPTTKITKRKQELVPEDECILEISTLGREIVEDQEFERKDITKFSGRSSMYGSPNVRKLVSTLQIGEVLRDEFDRHDAPYYDILKGKILKHAKKLRMGMLYSGVRVGYLFVDMNNLPASLYEIIPKGIKVFDKEDTIKMLKNIK